jgi:aspartate kinase
MSLLAHAGAQVLHARCVDLAAKYRVPLAVKSSFQEGEGTVITDPASMEGPAVRAVALDRHAVLAVLEGADVAPGAEGSVLEVLSALDVPVTQLALEAGHGRVRLAWTLSETEAAAFEAAWTGATTPAGRWQLSLERGRALVTLAGHDLAGDADVALAAARVLSRAEIPVIAARVTPLSVSFLVPSERADDAIRRLHAELVEKKS